MDRRALALAVALAAGACAPPPGVEVSRGAIGYRSEFVGSRLLVTIELALRFELVVRRLDPGVERPRELHRVDLGPPDWDITGLAVATGPRVWVSSMDGTVREVDIERGEVRETWRVGHSVTSIAATGDRRYLIYGTDRGAICLRRLRDGALLQCVRAHRRRVSALAVDDGGLVSGSWAGAIRRYRLPSLAVVGEHRVTGAVNDLAISDGRIAVATSSAPPVGDRRRRDLSGALVVIDGERSHTCGVHGAPVTAVSWSANGLVSGSWDRSARGWSVGASGCRGRWHRGLAGHHVTSLAIHPTRAQLAATLWVTDLDQPGVILVDFR